MLLRSLQPLRALQVGVVLCQRKSLRLGCRAASGSTAIKPRVGGVASSCPVRRGHGYDGTSVREGGGS